MELDSISRAKLDPANIRSVAPLTNYLMLLDMEHYDNFTMYTNIVEFHNYDESIAFRLINFNVDKFFPRTDISRLFAY
jgi:hypothetical protein